MDYANGERDFQDPTFWDADAAEERPAVKNPRAVVSVAFRREDYERVCEAAQRAEMRVSEYIREMALGRSPRPKLAVGRLQASGGLRTDNFTGAAAAHSHAVVDRLVPA